MFFLRRKLKRSFSVVMSCIAGLSFLALAVWGWGVSLREISGLLLIILLFLLLIVILAMIVGFSLMALRKRKNNRH